MERRKFLRGIAAVLGMVAILPALLKGQEKMVKKKELRNLIQEYPVTYEEAFKPQKEWKLIFDGKGELPDIISIELQHRKGGNGWTVHDTRQPGRDVLSNHRTVSRTFLECPCEIKMYPGKSPGEIHTVVLSYKYKDDSMRRYVYISAKNFHEKNNYTFKISLLEKGSKFDRTYIGHDPVSGSYSITICKIPDVDSMIRT